jgi:hypothetical protein
MTFLMLVDPLIRKPDAYTEQLHNEEDSEVIWAPCMRVFRVPKSGGVTPPPWLHACSCSSACFSACHFALLGRAGRGLGFPDTWHCSLRAQDRRAVSSCYTVSRWGLGEATRARYSSYIGLSFVFFFFETLGFELKTLHLKTTGLFSDSSNIC